MSSPRIIRPRSRWVRPAGPSRINWPTAPRGLIFSVDFADPSFRELTGGGGSPWPWGAPVLSSSPAIAPSGYGNGLLINGGSECVAFPTLIEPPTVWSMEILLTDTNPTAGGGICGFNSGSNGQGGAYDRSLGGAMSGLGTLVGSNIWEAYLYDGTQRFIGSGGSFIQGERVHLVATVGPDNTFSLYVNGSLAITDTVSNGGYTAYGSPVYFCFGRCGPAGNLGGNSFATCVVHVANLAAAEWSAAEVLQRYNNPFSHLAFPEDTLWAMLGGAAIAAGSVPYDPWPLWMPVLSQ